jgi:glycosyltransferase involved in cell wall biosynthesis
VAAANLDRSKPFISVVPDDKIEDIDYVREKVVENRQISIKMRKEIREYAREHFSWDNVVDKYLRVLNWRIDE